MVERRRWRSDSSTLIQAVLLCFKNIALISGSSLSVLLGTQQYEGTFRLLLCVCIVSSNHRLSVALHIASRFIYPCRLCYLPQLSRIKPVLLFLIAAG